MDFLIFFLLQEEEVPFPRDVGVEDGLLPSMSSGIPEQSGGGVTLWELQERESNVRFSSMMHASTLVAVFVPLCDFFFVCGVLVSFKH